MNLLVAHIPGGLNSLEGWPTELILLVLLVNLAIWILWRKHHKKNKKRSGKSHQSLKRFDPRRGNASERAALKELVACGLPPQDIFHDLYVVHPNGKTSQIDLVAMTRIGLIVIEVKDYAGRIIGKGTDEEWTQKLSHGRIKNRHQSPFLQNERHIKALRTLSRQMASLPMYSLVVFFGDCDLSEIKNLPAGCYLIKEYHIKQTIQALIKAKPDAKYTNKKEIRTLLDEAVQHGSSRKVRQSHVRQIQELVSS